MGELHRACLPGLSDGSHNLKVGGEWQRASSLNRAHLGPARGQFLFDGRYTGDKIRFPDLVYDMKMQMLREAFPSEMNVLTSVLNRISESERQSRDFTLNSLRLARL